MAHFAQLDENNKVIQVIVVDNNDIKNKEFPASEPIGQKFIESIGLTGKWKQTSYNHKFRGSYAGIGGLYLEDFDKFIGEKPFESWTFNSIIGDWEPPIPMPEGPNWFWDEISLNWVQFDI